MKVTMRNWTVDVQGTDSAAAVSEETENEEGFCLEAETEAEAEADVDMFTASAESLSTQDSGGSFQVKSSLPDDSVGQLAAMLSRAKTRLDVQQVSSKAMRAMVNLKAALIGCEGDEREKALRMIKRMEKLQKRINKKLENLDKEEQLERRREIAVKKQQTQKADEIGEELRSRRAKRRKDEQNYANRELAQDQKEAAAEMSAGLSDALSIATTPEVSDAVLSLSAASGGESVSVPEGISLDVVV